MDLNREIVFKNSGATYTGIPVIASNMDTVGTFEMAKALAQVLQKKRAIRTWLLFFFGGGEGKG